MISWDEWRGQSREQPTMLIKRLFERWGYRVDLHKMIHGDDVGCFHSQPAIAIRIILWGGYFEELKDQILLVNWKPGNVGIVRPETVHRIDCLHKSVSYSLWLRGRKTHKINIIGAC